MLIASALLIALSILLLAISLTTLYAATYAWRYPHARDLTAYPALDGSDALSFSLIMPCRHESEAVMRATLDRLLAQRHTLGAPTAVEVLISVGDDDLETTRIAGVLAAEHPDRVRVAIDRNPVKNKPRQLNSALMMCQNEIVGVFDAESIAAPDLLRNIDNCFRSTGADAVQGAVQLVNYQDTWFSLRNCLEYFIWFASRLHMHAKLGFIPLGGNTVFVKRALLDEVGGWDEECLAEDCELGVRLSTLQHRIVVAYSPELVTREETPDTIRALVKQRTRWSLGFMQVYAKGLWRSLPTFRERITAWWTLTQQHMMALSGIAIPTAIALAIWGKFPIPVTLTTFLPLIVVFVMVVFEACMLREFGRDHGLPIRVRDYVILVVSTPVYHLLLAFAAIRAYTKFRTGDFAWEKTAHPGRHLRLLATSAAR